MRLPNLLVLLAFALVACMGSREKDAVGTWASATQRITTSPDKTFHQQMGRIAIDGVWSMEGDDVTFTPKTMSGRSMSDIRARLVARSASNPVAKRLLRDFDKPNVLKLSPDGKQMATDATKDTNTSPWKPLTKDGG